MVLIPAPAPVAWSSGRPAAPPGGDTMRTPAPRCPLLAEWLEDRTAPTVSVRPPFVNAEGNTEWQLYDDWFHFGTVQRSPQGRTSFRPHPDLNDVNGFGSTF